MGEPDCGSTELSLLSIFGRLISLLYLHYGVQSGATPTGCSQLYCAAEKSLLKPRPPLLLSSCSSLSDKSARLILSPAKRAHTLLQPSWLAMLYDGFTQPSVWLHGRPSTYLHCLKLVLYTFSASQTHVYHTVCAVRYNCVRKCLVRYGIV